MNRNRFKKRSGELRSLLWHFREQFKRNDLGRGDFTSGGFGIFYDDRYGKYRIVNTHKGNVIATVKVKLGSRESRVIVRYRPKSFYSYILKNPELWDLSFSSRAKKTIIIPSTSLGKHSSQAIGRVTSLVESGDSTVPNRAQMVFSEQTTIAMDDVMDMPVFNPGQRWTFSRTEDGANIARDIYSNMLESYQQEYERAVSANFRVEGGTVTQIAADEAWFARLGEEFNPNIGS